MNTAPQLVCFGEALTDLVTQGGADFRALPGGAVWNVARAASALGIAAAWAGCVSQDSFGDQLLQASRAAGLNLDFIRRVAAPPLLAVVDRIDPPHYFFIGEGAADLAFDESLLPAAWDADLRWAHFGGISLVREPLGSRLEQLAQRLKGEGRRISFDPNHRALMTAADVPRLRRFVALSDVIKISDEDLRGYFPGQAPEVALAALRAHNPGATWLYTRGAAGASLWADGEFHDAPARTVQVVDTVGAGDASLAGLLLAILQGEPAKRQLQFALTNAALACSAAGAQAPTRAALLAAL